ncbi:hypothetical protein KL86CLO1_10475 [uncultured Eubacteriales bacterium]|uniref:Uncharacterized protein n=1 Tax=uncultured Eubacteriales bacterium TaxID=172733 RepID=A0A212J3Y4_9FIRM|nr:hypothetical protein KL86CLO1_10475 [uncultured Eubacteriales bacterium]
MSELKPCPIDVMKVRKLCYDGALQAYVEDEYIYLKDTASGEVVWIGDAPDCRAQPDNDPLTLEELRGMLERLEEECRQAGDGHEDYTNGFRWGHRNGQMELLRRILKISDGACESDRRKPEGGDPHAQR